MHRLHLLTSAGLGIGILGSAGHARANEYSHLPTGGSCLPGSLANPVVENVVTLPGTTLTACTVHLENYASSLCTGTMAGQPNYPVVSNGSTLCLASFTQAVADSEQYFENENMTPTGNSFQIKAPAGSFDLSADTNTSGTVTTTPLFELANASASQLPFVNPEGVVERLIIAGAGKNETAGGTLLKTDHGQATFDYSSNDSVLLSHVTIQDIHLGRNRNNTSQASIVGASTVAVDYGGVVYQGLVVSVINQGSPGFNSPVIGLGYHGGQYMRMYINGLESDPVGNTLPTLDGLAITLNAPATVDWTQYNGQLSYNAICDYSSGSATNCLSSWGSSTLPPQWNNSSTLVMLLDPGQEEITDFYFSEISASNTFHAGKPRIVCIKDEGGGGGFVGINDITARPSGQPGTDLQLLRLKLTETAYSQIQSVANITIENVSIERGSAVNGQYPCLSVAGGGIQIHGTDGANGTATPTYGNQISNFAAVATGDDTISITGDIGGFIYTGINGALPNCSYNPMTDTNTCPVSTIYNSNIQDSFVRSVRVVPDPSQPISQTTTYLDIPPFTGPNLEGPDSWPTINGTFSTLHCPLTPGLPNFSSPNENWNCMLSSFTKCPTTPNPGLPDTVTMCPVHVDNGSGD